MRQHLCERGKGLLPVCDCPSHKYSIFRNKLFPVMRKVAIQNLKLRRKCLPITWMLNVMVVGVSLIAWMDIRCDILSHLHTNTYFLYGLAYFTSNSLQEVEATQKLQQKEKRVKCIEDNCNLEFDSREKMFAHYMTHVEC